MAAGRLCYNADMRADWPARAEMKGETPDMKHFRISALALAAAVSLSLAVPASAASVSDASGTYAESIQRLAEEGIDVRVVSMPCMDVFEEQSEEYKEEVLPKSVRKRVAVEALGEFGWGKYVGLDGAVIAMEGFGASGPAGQLFEKFGFTVDHVVEAVKGLK